MQHLGNILDFVSSVGFTIIDVFSAIPDVFDYGFTFDGVDYSVWGVMFSAGGIALYVTRTVIRWITGL